MAYEILFYQTNSGRRPINHFINKLRDKEKSKVIWALDLLKIHGKKLWFPYLRYLKSSNGIWELRVKRIRLFLVFISDKKILIVHAIEKKTNKTPLRDIKLVKTRLLNASN